MNKLLNFFFVGTFLMVWKWAWYCLAAFMWGYFYESTFASNTDGHTEKGTIIGALFFFACAVYSVYRSLNFDKNNP